MKRLISVLLSLGLVIALGLNGCSEEKENSESNKGELAEKDEAPSPQARPEVIDPKLIEKLIGKFVPEDGSDPYKNFEITADKIRCNHSNHSNEYRYHPYGVMSAIDDKIVLGAADGALSLEVGDDDEIYIVDALGICPWGLESRYTRSKAGTGSPAILLDEKVRKKRKKQEIKLNKEVKLPQANITFEKVKRSKWVDDDDTTHVLNIKINIESKVDQLIEPFLARELSEFLDTEDSILAAECANDAESRGIGNTMYKDHRTPAFDDGVYTRWGGHRETIIKPQRRRRGWIALLMNKEATGKCNITFDALGLGGGILRLTVDLDR